jgi:hypothetical protein
MTVAAVRIKRPAVKGAGKPGPSGKAKKPRSLKESREEWLRRLRAEYTPEVCAQTLAVHESLPIDGEP